MRKLFAVMLLSTLVLTVGFFASPVLAVNNKNVLYQGVNCNDKVNQDSAVCSRGKADSDPLTGNGGVLEKVTNVVAFAAGATAVIMILISSMRFVSSGGDSGRVKRARDTVIYSLIGLIIIILARSIIMYAINTFGS